MAKNRRDSDDINITAKAKRKKKKSKKRKSNDPSLTSSSKQQSSSLAQLLKKHRGVAADTAPPPVWKDTRTNNSSSSFLTPNDNPQAFKDCLQTSYAGFHYDKPEALPSSLHNMFDSSFGCMDKGGLFLYDVVQPGKKRLTRTSVTRCLVGAPGSTYKYLGLRLFSHPWTDVDSNGNSIQDAITGSSLKKLGYSDKTTSALISMGYINSTLTKRSKAMLQELVSPHFNPVGSADYNLTLVNKMESMATKKDLKQENAYGMGKISVGWHRDSGLRDFSSIAVYQTLKDTQTSSESQPWSVALRAMDGGSGGVLNDVPPLVVPLPSGSLYYMLDDFNHNHEHAVIAGDGGIRYSSTHRVAREGAGTWQYIRDKVESFLSTMGQFDMENGIVKDSDPSTPDQLSRKRSEKKLISHIRAQQNLMTEIEFEWIRQWYVQGKKHASLHPYWHGPIKNLTTSFSELEESASKLLSLLSSSQGTSHVTEDLYDVLIEAYTERSRLRSMWKERYRDPVFDNIPEDERPIPCPNLGKVEDTDKVVSQLRHWRSLFVDKSSDDPHDMKKKSKKKSKKGSLTKKESKARSSNWEKLRATMK